jgi:hypothetical protein
VSGTADQQEGEMDGIQMTVWERLMEVATKVKEGAYGEDDDFDADALSEDLNTLTFDL